MKALLRVFPGVLLFIALVLMPDLHASAESQKFTAQAETFDAARGVIVSAANFPDPTFRAYVEEACDTDGDLVLTEAEIAAVTEMDIHDYGIYDLSGIGFFTALSTLNCSENRLTSLDVSGLPKLEYLYCQSNYAFHVDDNEELEPENTGDDSELTGEQDIMIEPMNPHDPIPPENPYDLSEGEVIASESAGVFLAPVTDAGITTLTVGSAPLKLLWCWDNSLTALDLSSCPTLEDVSCSANLLETLDVSGLPALTRLLCSDNALCELDISANPELAYLWCWNNSIEWLDISRCPKLMTAMAEGTREKGDGFVAFFKDEADITFSPTTIIYQGAAPDGVPITAETFPDEAFRAFVRDIAEQNYDGALSEGEIAEVEEIRCYGRPFNSVEGIRTFTSLRYLTCGWNAMTELDVSGMPALEAIYCSGLSLDLLKVRGATALRVLSIQDTAVSELDAGGLPALEELDCSSNQLTSLNVSGDTSLYKLDVHANTLAELDVSGLPALGQLDCSYNRLTALNTKGDTALRVLRAQSNRLEELNLHTNRRLHVLWCWDNPMQGLDVSDCPTLSSLALHGLTEKYGGEQGDYISYYDKAGSGDLSVDLALSEHVTAVFSAALDEETFPDERFRAYVQVSFDGDGDGFLDGAEIAAVREIDCPGMEIADLTGVELFEALRTLCCRDNALTALPLSALHALETLDCSGNSLTALDTGRNPALLSLDCSDNRIAALTLGNNYALEKLYCASNNMNSLNLVDCDTIAAFLRTGAKPKTEDGVCVYSGLFAIEGEEPREIVLSHDAGVPLWAAPYPEPDCVLPEQLCRIEARAFQGCDFACAEVGGGVTAIGEYAFADSSKLRCVYLPPNVTDIAPSAFDGDEGLTVFGMSGSAAETWALQNGFVFFALHG